MSLSGSLREVVGTLVARFERPLVTVPTNAAAVVTAAAVDSVDARVVIDTEVTSSLSTRSKMRFVEPTVDVRGGSVDSLVVSDDGGDRLAAVATSGGETLAVVDDTGVDSFDHVWRTGESVTFDVPAHSEFVGEVHERLGSRAATVVDGGASAVDGEVINGATAAWFDPAGLLVFGGARGRCLWSEVVGVARSTGLCSRRTLQRRLSTLQERDLVRTVPAERETAGGRPNRLEPVDDAVPPTASDDDDLAAVVGGERR